MSEQTASPEALLKALAEAGQQAGQAWLRLLAQPGGGHPGTPPANAWLEDLGRQVQAFPALQTEYLARQAELWQRLLVGESRDDPARRAPTDRRFAAAAWRENAYFSYLRESYLLATEFLHRLVDRAEADDATRARLRFAVVQWTDAMCPANFMATNPDAMRAAIDSGGESLVRGLANLIGDAHKGRISQTDESAFEVGRDLAATPGAVVHENPLAQIIQYAPATTSVMKRPLVIIPPCINKFYILDLQPHNSFVRYAVSRGHTVFMVSWRNPGAAESRYGWDDYLDLGVLTALRVALEVTRADRANMLGFCVGGTLLGAALAVLAARSDDRVASATFLTTMLDFAEPGQIGLFVDQAGVAVREAAIGRGGLLAGAELAFVFSSLRANDLIWPYVVNNYLKGTTPAAFDLLHWNADGTNLPGPMYCYYVRNTYLENRLRQPGALVNCGAPVDLRRVTVPSFVYASREDHIVPWRAAYASLDVLGGEHEFVLGASGHIAGVINPPDPSRRSHWAGTSIPGGPDAWLAAAQEQAGSWWPRWADWLRQHGGGTRRAPRALGNRKYRPGEPAPGRYVKQPAPPVAGPSSADAPAAAQA